MLQTLHETNFFYYEQKSTIWKREKNHDLIHNCKPVGSCEYEGYKNIYLGGILNHLQIMRIAHDMRRQSVMIQSFNARQFCLIGKQLSAEFRMFKIRLTVKKLQYFSFYVPKKSSRMIRMSYSVSYSGAEYHIIPLLTKVPPAHSALHVVEILQT